MQDEYESFITKKLIRAAQTGFTPKPLLSRRGAKCKLFPWQQEVTKIALMAGKFAMFCDCGLGKSGMQVIWADEVTKHTGKPVLILCPLAVAEQTVNEGNKFGVKVKHVREAEELKLTGSGIYITNYDRLEKFLGAIKHLGGVVLDESSLLKSFTGKTRIMLTQAFKETEYKLCCTATPAPNDYTELGQHAEFLNVMNSGQMLATWFINDTSDTGSWRLKKHARADFWRWVGSWAACISKPSDIGFSDEGYDLPPLELHNHSIAVDETSGASDGELFRASSVSAATLQKEARFSLTERCEEAVRIATSEDTPCIIWCELNDESETLKKLLREAVEIKGADKDKTKEAAAMWFCAMPVTYEQLHLIGKSDKLAACGNQNTLPAGNKDTIRTPPSESDEGGSPGHPDRTESICGNTTSGTPTNSGCPTPSETPKTQGEGSDTPAMKKSGVGRKKRPGNGSKQIHGSEKPNDSGSLESASINSKQCSSGKAEGAPFADGQIPATQGCSQSLTIATKQEGCEESCALHATSDSDISGTTQQTYAEPPDTFRALISKPEIFGFGMNMQVCTRQVFVGQSWSMERQYQAIRRSYRFGQTKPVHIHFITPSTLGDVRVRVREKFAAHEAMKLEMKEAAKELSKDKQTVELSEDMPHLGGDRWNIYNGDCVAVARKHILSESVGFSLHSPPFADLFTYSNRPEDMGNCSSMEDFMTHYRFMAEELFRVTMPGRECAVHCGDLLSTKWKHGVIELQDFSGEITRLFRSVGFQFHARVTIWKSPVTEMQRTKAHGLLYKTLRKDSAASRVGMPDYLLVFRKPGENPKPITHSETDFPLDDWQEIASPVWMTIEQGNVLNRKGSKEQGDERHICPLQLDVIERALKLWSAPGDLVYSPFTGIGSEGYQAVKMQRNFVGSELKASYFKDAALWMTQAESERELFSLDGALAAAKPAEAPAEQPSETELL